MKKMARKTLAIVLAAAMFLAISACGGGKPSGQGGQSGTPEKNEGRTEALVVKVGSLGSGRAGDALAVGIEKMAEYVEEKTNGMITFEFFYGGQLGSEQDMLDQIISGSLDMAPLSGTVLASIWPEMYVYTLPFAFNGFEDYYEVCGVNGANDGAVHKMMSKIVEDSGKAHCLSSAFCGNFRGCFNSKHAIRSASDFEGLTFRIQAGEIFSDIYGALGASTAAIPFAELYTSIQQGVCDGADLGVGFTYDNKFQEIAKFNTELNHCLCGNPMLMSNKLWDKLSEEERQIFRDSMVEAEKAGMQECIDAYETYYPLLAEAGVEVIRFADLTKEEVATFRNATAPVWEKYKSVVGEDVFNTFQDARIAVYGDVARIG